MTFFSKLNVGNLVIGADSTRPLKEYFRDNRDALANAVEVLSGIDGSNCLAFLFERLATEQVLSRRTIQNLEKFRAILFLEGVEDLDSEEALLFAQIALDSPIVEEICLLADGLDDAIREWLLLSQQDCSTEEQSCEKSAA